MSQALEDVKALTNIPDFESRIKDEEILYTQDHLDVM